MDKDKKTEGAKVQVQIAATGKARGNMVKGVELLVKTTNYWLPEIHSANVYGDATLVTYIGKKDANPAVVAVDRKLSILLKFFFADYLHTPDANHSFRRLLPFDTGSFFHYLNTDLLQSPNENEEDFHHQHNFIRYTHLPFLKPSTRLRPLLSFNKATELAEKKLISAQTSICRITAVGQDMISIDVLVDTTRKMVVRRRLDKQPLEGYIPLEENIQFEWKIMTYPCERRFIYRQLEGTEKIVFPGDEDVHVGAHSADFDKDLFFKPLTGDIR